MEQKNAEHSFFYPALPRGRGGVGVGVGVHAGGRNCCASAGWPGGPAACGDNRGSSQLTGIKPQLAFRLDPGASSRPPGGGYRLLPGRPRSRPR